jgi:hypothetical protein
MLEEWNVCHFANKFQELRLVKEFGVKETEVAMHTLETLTEEMAEPDTCAGDNQSQFQSTTEHSEMLKVEDKMDIASLLSVEIKIQESESLTTLMETLKEDN